MRPGETLRIDRPIPKLYWSIGEAAKELGVEPSHIRFIEGYFSVPGHRNGKGDRRYTRSNIDALQLILRVTESLKLPAALKIYKQNGVAGLREIEPHLL